ncbi:MAG TPA: glycosyltransferase family 2 protein, partial [Vicinamibacterales bacterium]|nr:glycosyltransferase family 2 protein [Vicinamibacterales bacterium]
TGGHVTTTIGDLADLEASFSLPTVSVVIPALNEARNLEHVLPRIPGYVFEVILVDGNSADDTVAVARKLRPDIKIVQQNRRGKGNALACGFAACSGEIIVMLDADGSTDPAEIPAFVASLTAGADFAKGSRFAGDGCSRDITRIRRAGNLALNWLVNVLFGTRFTDLCYGYNAFWAHCMPSFGLSVGEAGERVWGDGFEIETSSTCESPARGRALPKYRAWRAAGFTARRTSTRCKTVGGCCGQSSANFGQGVTPASSPAGPSCPDHDLPWMTGFEPDPAIRRGPSAAPAGW